MRGRARPPRAKSSPLTPPTTLSPALPQGRHTRTATAFSSRSASLAGSTYGRSVDAGAAGGVAETTRVMAESRIRRTRALKGADPGWRRASVEEAGS